MLVSSVHVAILRGSTEQQLAHATRFNRCDAVATSVANLCSSCRDSIEHKWSVLYHIVMQFESIGFWFEQAIHFAQFKIQSGHAIHTLLP